MFNGFTPATIDFLWGIRFNNNRDWFQQHKSEYQRDLYEPMLALAQAVREQFSIEGTILKTSRIYRDVRYSGGIPYKEHLWFCIRQGTMYFGVNTRPCISRSNRRAAGAGSFTMRLRRR